MPNNDDFMLILEPDPQSQDLLKAVAERLGCEHVETDSPQGLHDALAGRRPTIAVVAVDRSKRNGFSALHAIAEQGSKPATLLVGTLSTRRLASARRMAEGYGLPVLGVQPLPLDAFEVEQTLSPCLANASAISPADFEHAHFEHELSLQYLPKWAIASGVPKIHGVEALLRLQPPRRGLLQSVKVPAAFEERGFMFGLTNMVLAEAIRQAGLWFARGLSMQLVVNLGPGLVSDAAFPEKLAQLLSKCNFPPKHLMLDVVEPPGEEYRALILDVCMRLRILGVGLSIDNFGTRFWSLTELYQLPISEIQVDHTLLADVPRYREAGLIVKAIIRLARTRKITVSAEGIDSRQMFELARASGFDTAQGRFFSDALDACEVENLIKSCA